VVLVRLQEFDFVQLWISFFAVRVVELSLVLLSSHLHLPSRENLGLFYRRPSSPLKEGRIRVEKREKSNFQIIERNGFSRVVYWRASRYHYGTALEILFINS
jgi:hypothetical protein